MLSRLGFPSIRGNGRFVGALAIDAIGSGVWMPFELLFFVRITDLPLAHIGAAMSAGALVGIPMSILFGTVVDRYGAKWALLVGQLLMAVTFALSPLVRTMFGVWLVALGSSAANSLFWAAFMPLVASISAPGEREKWFGFLGAMRNVGFALGGLGAAVVLSVNSLGAYLAGAWINAGSYLISFLLLLGLRVAASSAVSGAASHPKRQIGTVLRDRGFMWFLLANLGYALSALALNVAIPIYLVKFVGLPGWVAGAAYIVNTVLVGFGQGLVVTAMTGRVRAQILNAAWLTFAVGFALLGVLPALPGWPALVLALVALVIYTLGELIGGPVLAAIGAEAPPEELRGSYAGFFQVSWGVANVIAPALFTWWLSLHVMWWGAVGVAGGAVLATWLMKSTLPAARDLVTNQARA